MVFKFLHLADVHLDTAFQSRSPQMRSFLRASLREAFRSAIDLAISEDCHALLVAGDLFDNETLSFTTERFLLQQMNRLREKNIAVFYAAGNHDPSGISYRAARMDWPANVHIFRSRRPEEVPLSDSEGNIRAVIAGAGYEGIRESENLAALFPPAGSREIPHIGLLHALVTGAGGSQDHERYAPCTLEDLREKDYKYWALGHVHAGAIISEDPHVVYSGSLMGRNARETGPKGVYLVEIHANDVKVDFRPLAPVRWENITVDSLEKAANLDKLQNIITGSVQEYFAGENPPERVFLRLNLTGPCPLYKELNSPENIAVLEEELSFALNIDYIEIKVEYLLPPVNPDHYRGKPHILGALLAVIDSVNADEEMLLQLAPEVLAGYQKKGDEAGKLLYLKSLFAGIDFEAAVRLLEADKL